MGVDGVFVSVSGRPAGCTGGPAVLQARRGQEYIRYWLLLPVQHWRCELSRNDPHPSPFSLVPPPPPPPLQEIVESQCGMLTTVAYQLGDAHPPMYALEGAVSDAGDSIMWLKDSLEFFKDFSDLGM